MKKKFRKVISLLLSVIVIFASTFAGNLSIYAATPVNLESSTFSLWADPNKVLAQEDISNFSTNKLSTLGGIKPFKNSTNNTSVYYLFLPSTTDCTNLRFWCAEDKTITIYKKGDQTQKTVINSGETTSALSDINQKGASATYMFKVDGDSEHEVLCMKSGDVGTVFVDTVSGSMKTVYGDSNHKKNEAGSIMVVQPDGTVDYRGEMEKIQGRGNATWKTGNEKNPFNVKLATSTSLLGMGKAKKWVLLANADDSSLLRNQITYDFAKYVGVKYQPTCKPVDLYINQQYYGSYQLSEKVEIKSSRIDVTDAYENLEIANGTTDAATGAVIPADFEALGTTVKSDNVGSGYTIGGKKYSDSMKNPSDITGGYLYELEISDRWIDENAGFCAYNKQCWVLKSCDYATKEMVNYSYDLLFAIGSAAYNGGTVPNKAVSFKYSPTTLFSSSSVTCSNPAPASQYQGKKWNELLDEDSTVRYYWVEEVFKNLDASTTSCYFFKDSDAIDAKVYGGPVWDMDKCWGSAGSTTRWGSSLTSSDGWYAKNVRIYKFSSTSEGLCGDSTDSKRPLALLGQLTTLNDYWSTCQRYWFAFISPAIDVLTGKATDSTGTLRSIDEYASLIQYTGKMNAQRFASTTSSGSYNSGASTLKSWVSNRQSYINNQFSTKLNINNAIISDIDDQTFTGNEIKPNLDITGTINNASVELKEGIDYTLEYANNVDAGTATVTITGIGMVTGTKTLSFNINPINIENGYSATIDPLTYMDVDLTVGVANENGNILNSNLEYQWYKNNAPIDGANSKTYTVTADDVGATIYAVVTGDNKNMTGTIKSNDCVVKVGQRPTGFTKTIAKWSYDYTNAESALANADETGLSRYYLATSGENQGSSKLSASVNAVDDAKIKWSGTADLYVNGEVTDQAPVMGTSKTDLLAWGEYPYFETTISTLGYENIAYSAKLGGTKKGPRDWKLQYSLDGNAYVDIENATYSIVENKTLEQAFENVILPKECEDQSILYIRAVACSNVAINGINAIMGQTSGDAAINDIVISGSSTGVVTSLKAPSFDLADGSVVFDDTIISVSDTNGGADLYCYVNDGMPQQYYGAIRAFDKNTAKAGDTVTVRAYAQFEDIKSDVTTVTYIYGGADLANFSYDTYTTDVVNGGVASVKGVYGKSGIMTATADGTSQYVPLWREDKGSFCVSPDDGLKWSKNSGFTYKVSTAGYENITFTADAYTTGQGPNSIVLQYSTNGIDFVDVTDNIKLGANGELENVFAQVKLPAECENKAVVYIRIATKENLTNLGATLHKAESKGNLYVNNVVIAGDDNGEYKMPYTNKSTDFFGENGTIKYYSPNGMKIQYAVLDSTDKVVLNGIVPAEGIKISSAVGFSAKEYVPYRVVTWVEGDEETSAMNVRTYYFKGSTIAKFDFTSTKRPLSSYLNEDGTIATNTSGTNSATLSMMPNGVDKAQLTYTDAYGVKVAWSEANPFTATKKLDVADGNGCWLIGTSTVGYSNVSISLSQISSNKGPRDWGLAYSLDGTSFAYLPNSNARAISNDASLEPVETYSNFVLPAECANREQIWLKLFINGGESVEGDELELMTKGNTGINSIEISGVPIPRIFGLTIKPVVMDTKDATEGTVSIDGVVSVNNNEYITENGEAVAQLTEGKTYEIKASLNGKTYITKTSVTMNEDTVLEVPIVAVDFVPDGIINSKDYAKLNRELKNETLKTHLKQIFANFY